MGNTSLIVLSIIGNSEEAKKKAKMATAAENAAQRQRQAAEDYIWNSGDKEAIKMLKLAQANPANYSNMMSGHVARGNDTLNTAMGVMAGVAVGNVVANAVTASAIANALENAQAELTGSVINTASSSIDLSDLL